MMPSNPFEYGILGLLIICFIVAIRYLVAKENSFEKRMEEKKQEYLELIKKKEDEIKEIRAELKESNEQRFEIVKSTIELSMQLINEINNVRGNKS